MKYIYIGRFSTLNMPDIYNMIGFLKKLLFGKKYLLDVIHHNAYNKSDVPIIK